MMEISGVKLEKLIIEGKTKQVWQWPSESDDTVVIVSKDRITAGDGVKSHNLKGKAAISTKTTSKVFEILQNAGIKTAFVKQENTVSFIAKQCKMIPIEWVTRRLATGSFLKRRPGVSEGYRFNPPLQETFFKDDENHDPQWSDEQILDAKFVINGVAIRQCELDIIKKVSLCVFEILEKIWSLKCCVLVDMKLEFGVDSKGNILLADVIDSDSWRLWPSGDKRLMKDKQVYRNLTQVTEDDLLLVKNNFEWIYNKLDSLLPASNSLVVIIMGSVKDEDYCKKISAYCKEYNVSSELRAVSAHKAPSSLLNIIAEYEGSKKEVVFIAVAGRSNGLGPTLAGNTTFPVINCPPDLKDVSRNIWSSLELPSGIGCSTVIYPESAAVMAAHIHSLRDFHVWAKLKVIKMNYFIELRKLDKHLQTPLTSNT